MELKKELDRMYETALNHAELALKSNDFCHLGIMIGLGAAMCRLGDKRGEEISEGNLALNLFNPERHDEFLEYIKTHRREIV